jgi:hypothetical protein
MKINCKTNDTLPLSALREFQGALKERSDADVDKIIKSINEHGFAVPFFVWVHDGVNNVLDGHGRLLALNRMMEAGTDIPRLPVVYINAENEEQAKKLLLKINSAYGKMSRDSVLEFMDGIKFDPVDFELPNVEWKPVDFGGEEDDSDTGGDKEADYKEKIELIIKCDSESHAEKLYDEFKKRRLVCRISTL